MCFKQNIYLTFPTNLQNKHASGTFWLAADFSLSLSDHVHSVKIEERLLNQ